MNITICGHAGLFIETEKSRVLIDPILRVTPLASGGVAHILARELDLSQLPQPTLVVVTHAHLDHFDPESLMLLPRDVPVLAPEDSRLLAQLANIGFTRISSLAAWQSLEHRGIVLTATPSDTEIDEFGLVIRSKEATLWHMSDAEAGPDVAFRIVKEFGPVDVASVKFQPASRVQSQVIRSLGACFDKADVVRSLETACLCKPKMAFPYAAGIRFHGDAVWFNKHALPFRPDEISRLLNLRLAGDGRAVTVLPGDLLSIQRGDVVHLPQSAKFVRHDPTGGGEIEWEPIEPSTLMGVTDEERAELRRLLIDVFQGPFAEWLHRECHPEGRLSSLLEFDVQWQLVVHTGPTTRLEFGIDFSTPGLAIVEGRNPYANFFAHVAGKALYRHLRGDAGPEILYACGNVRVYEKIVSVKNGRIWAPPVQGWDLFEHLPELLTFFLRYRHKLTLL